MDYQITHIIPDSTDPDRRIDAIYGPVCGLVYEDAAIRDIDWGTHTYFTMAYNLYRADIYAVTNSLGTRFLTTSPDGIGVNNLCQLPRLSG